MGDVRNVAVVNGNSTLINEGETIFSLLDRLFPLTSGIAVAINAEVLPRSEWNDFIVHNGDVIEILAPTSGG